jgi:hypothetical protein
LDAAFDENQRTFFQILLGDFGLLAPDNNLVPLGALLAFAVAIFVGLVGGDGEIGDGLAAGSEAGFGVAAETTDEDDFVNGLRRDAPQDGDPCRIAALLTDMRGAPW